MTFDPSEIDDDPSDDWMHTLVGRFIAMYSAADLALGTLLASVSGIDDLELFHILSKGLDAKTKVQRLREIEALEKPIPKGGALDRRLSYFVAECSDLRNKIAHQWLVPAKGLPEAMIFASLGRLPTKEFKMQRRSRLDPEWITLEALALHVDWLDCFADDIASVRRASQHGEPLEIAHPRSKEPKDFQKRLADIERHANDHRRKQSPLPKS